MSEFYAKSVGNPPPTVGEHLSDVSELAKAYGAAFSQGSQTALCGQFHDFGKYSAAFQEVLRGNRTGVDHAICGAAFVGQKKYRRAVAEVIAAHHSRLISFEALEPNLKKSRTDQQPVRTEDGKQVALSGLDQYAAAQEQFLRDFPAFRYPGKEGFLPVHPDNDPLAYMLYTRMLLSCLADADYTVSANQPPEEGAPLDAARCLDNLYAYQNQLSQHSTSEGSLNRLRNALFTRCGEAAAQPGGLFTLTAPTGTGKTLALLHFALKHCLHTGKRRIIVVLPYLSLIEQSAAVYSQIIPDILEDHSQRELPDELREHAARWDQPFIITTSVRFFEALFADRPTDCRKLHNIASSVILFDEAQSLPLSLTRPTLAAVNELCSRYNCTMVFSTATQPAFSMLKDTPWSPREILPEHPTYYDQLRRTQVRWEVDEMLPLEQLARQMADCFNVCAIVNLRRHARKLYKELAAFCPEEAVFLISTDLCPAHRTWVINEIKARQNQGQPCYVVSTQCIEAGVDLDFDRLYRAIAPLEAIIQAAGRCNRNGRNGVAQVTVFIPEEEGRLYPDASYGNAANVVQTMLAQGDVDIHDPTCIRAYYAHWFGLYRSTRSELTDAIRDLEYSEVAQKYKLIPDSGVRVIVPYEPQRPTCDAIRQQAVVTPQQLREAEPITVTVYRAENLESLCEPLYILGHGGVKQPCGTYILRAGQEGKYDCCTGLSLDVGNPAQNSLLIL